MRAAWVILVPMLVDCSSPASGNQDDTYELLDRANSVVRLSGDYGLLPYKYNAGRAAIDARSAVFTVANSKNVSPSQATPCKKGALPTNPYPLSIQDSKNAALVGGFIQGRIPQSSNWEFTYCNSAAILFKRSGNGVIDGVRIAGAWDAIRASEQSTRLTLRNSWISSVRDDFFENDYLYPVEIQDTLVDGAFQGVSLHPGSRSRLADASTAIVNISGLLIRIREYPYKGEMRYGSLTKSESRSPRLRIRNSIVAIDYRGGKTFPAYWSRTWSKLAGSSNNMLLWLSDSPIPATFPMPPSSFKVVKGRAARELWVNAKTNWINCHPKLVRTPSDTRSIERVCQRGTWGGHRD